MDLSPGNCNDPDRLRAGRTITLASLFIEPSNIKENPGMQIL
jgi:hypothetical protein